MARQTGQPGVVGPIDSRERGLREASEQAPRHALPGQRGFVAVFSVPDRDRPLARRFGHRPAKFDPVLGRAWTRLLQQRDHALSGGLRSNQSETGDIKRVASIHSRRFDCLCRHGRLNGHNVLGRIPVAAISERSFIILRPSRPREGRAVPPALLQPRPGATSCASRWRSACQTPVEPLLSAFLTTYSREAWPIRSRLARSPSACPGQCGCGHTPQALARQDQPNSGGKHPARSGLTLLGRTDQHLEILSQPELRISARSRTLLTATPGGD